MTKASENTSPSLAAQATAGTARDRRGTRRQPPLTVLGIETSCDETAAAVVRLHADGRGEILSNLVYSQVREHAAFGGVVPEIAARAHVSRLDRLMRQALHDAGLHWRDLDGVAVTAGPGLIGGLLVGLMSAKAVALAHRLPLLAVNHLEAHALSPMLSAGSEPPASAAADGAADDAVNDAAVTVRPPYLLLLVSGGHTQLVSVDAVGRYRRLGTTIDDALGEAFDKVAKMLDLGYPGGPRVEALARDGDAARFDFPRPMLGRAECHFSFSGLKTAVRTTLLQLGDAIGPREKADICASFQQAAAEALADRVRCGCRRFRALHGDMLSQPAAAEASSPWLVLAGGVAANRALRAALRTVAREEGFRLAAPPPALCTDNAAMVAHAGAFKLLHGDIAPLSIAARARWPLDEAAEPAPFAGVKG